MEEEGSTTDNGSGGAQEEETLSVVCVSAKHNISILSQADDSPHLENFGGCYPRRYLGDVACLVNFKKEFLRQG